MSRYTDPGILILDKPSEITSMTAIKAVKKKLNVNKIGHAGTLDPLATGVLVCLLNSATRLATYAKAGSKCYSGVFTTGLRSSTDDIDGQLEQLDCELPDLALLQSTCKNYLGDIEQVPPQVSAVKVNGEKAYNRARRGLKTELASRPINITSFEVFASDNVPKTVPSSYVKASYGYRVVCSSGTYVRSLIRDLGEELGCGAIVSSLRREYSLPFTVEQAVTMDDLGLKDVQCWTKLFPNIEKIDCSHAEVESLRSGNQSVLKHLSKNCDSLSSDLIVYREGSQKLPCGLLQKAPVGWKIGVNLT